MPTMDETSLRRRMAAGELSGLFVVAGEEKYMVGRLARQLIKRAAGDAFPEFNNQAFTDTSSLDSVGDAAQALPFFAQRKCVSVADFDVETKTSQELDKLYELWELCPETTTLVFWYPTLEFDGKRSSKWKKFLKQAEERGAVVLCGRRSQTELLRFLAREAEKAGCVLDRAAGLKLLDYAGQDLTSLQNEVEKLCAYALGQGAPAITGDMVEELVAKSTETTVFLLAKALVSGQYETAYNLLDTLFYQREDPIAIVGALAASYLDMVRVRAALESGHSYSDAAQYADYKGRDFRLRNAQQNVRGLPQQVLHQSVHLLLEADLALKSSRLDGRIRLEELVAKLLLAAQGDRS